MAQIVGGFIVLPLTGAEVLSVLETSVSKAPKRSPDFMQVSGIRFWYNDEMVPGKRVGGVQCRCRDGAYAPLQMNRTYECAMKRSTAHSYIGLSCFPSKSTCEIRKTGEAQDLASLIREFLRTSAEFGENEIALSCFLQRALQPRPVQSLDQRYREILEHESRMGSEKSLATVRPRVEGRITRASN